MPPVSFEAIVIFISGIIIRAISVVYFGVFLKKSIEAKWYPKRKIPRNLKYPPDVIKLNWFQIKLGIFNLNIALTEPL
ncbi:MAG: hypothetical protein ACJAUR_001498 [Ulvibacter sp.]